MRNYKSKQKSTDTDSDITMNGGAVAVTSVALMSDDTTSVSLTSDDSKTNETSMDDDNVGGPNIQDADDHNSDVQIVMTSSLMSIVNVQ